MVLAKTICIIKGFVRNSAKLRRHLPIRKVIFCALSGVFVNLSEITNPSCSLMNLVEKSSQNSVNKKNKLDSRHLDVMTIW